MNYRIGVDGGGTKTECILVDARGEVVARHTAPGCNPSVAGGDRARAVLDAALRTLRAGISAPVEASLFCMAGSPSFWRETAAGLSECGRVMVVDDAQPVLELATGGGPGLAVHAGTGSFVVARAPDGAVHYAGGLGWRFGDPGCGHDLGRRAIGRVLLSLQGWGGDIRSEALEEALRRHLGARDFPVLVRQLYQDPSATTTVAAFAPCVLDLADGGDAISLQIVADSMTGLVDLVDRVMIRLFAAGRDLPGRSAIPLGVSGSILNRPSAKLSFQTLAGPRGWPAVYRPITMAPIEGVKTLLGRLF